MDHEAAVQLWAMPVDRLTEADVAPWLAVLDETERQRHARLALPHSRVEYVAAHALARALLARVTGLPSTRFRYALGPKGKPQALVDGAPAGVGFNLSHTAGLVAVAASRSVEPGIDVEAVDRDVDLAVAGRYFFGAESRWLDSLEQARRRDGFLRLWTLKEAYIKATGRGLSQPLDQFWFDVEPPRIRFTAAIADDEAAWRFEQRVVAGRFLIAVGWRLAGGLEPSLALSVIDPAELRL